VFITKWLFSVCCYENRIFIADKNRVNARNIKIFVSKVIGCWLNDQYAIPDSGRNLSLPRFVHTGYGTHPAPCSVRTEVFLPRGKEAGASKWTPAGILFLLPSTDRNLVPHSFLYNGYKGSFPEGKAVGA
jgi:hypothetical protein